LPVFPARQGGCKGFIKTGAEGAHIHLPFTIHHLPFPHGRPPPSEPSAPSGLQGRSILKPFLTKWQNHLISLRHVISNFFRGGVDD
jgi:hypothetical protein